MLLLTSYTKIAVLPALEISLFQIHQKAAFEENNNNNKITLSSLEVSSLDSHLNLNYNKNNTKSFFLYSFSFLPFPKCSANRKEKIQATLWSPLQRKYIKMPLSLAIWHTPQWRVLMQSKLNSFQFSQCLISNALTRCYRTDTPLLWELTQWKRLLSSINFSK